LTAPAARHCRSNPAAVTDPRSCVPVCDTGFHRGAAALCTFVLAAAAVTDRTDRSLAGERACPTVPTPAGRACVELAWAARLTKRLAADAIGDSHSLTAAGAGIAPGRILDLATRADNAAVLAGIRSAKFAATHAHLEMRLRITTATNTRAVPAVRQRSLCSTPVAAHALHGRVFGGQDVEKRM